MSRFATARFLSLGLYVASRDGVCLCGILYVCPLVDVSPSGSPTTKQTTQLIAYWNKAKTAPCRWKKSLRKKLVVKTQAELGLRKRGAKLGDLPSRSLYSPTHRLLSAANHSSLSLAVLCDALDSKREKRERRMRL